MKMTELQPKAVWKYFDDMCKIPHATYNEEAISKYLFNAFKAIGCEVEIDKYHNVFACLKASKGCENYPSVLLQAHSDMVANKKHGSNHDFAKDPIIPIVTNDGWVRAKDTTLGADDGIGVALILALFADKTIKHGPLEALITSGEEEGLIGVQNFDLSKITAKYLINLDNEDDSEIGIGCMGNCDLVLKMSYQRDKTFRKNSKDISIKITGGKGGHSGNTIAEKRVNAIKTIFNYLGFVADSKDIRLVEFKKSGTAKNNIPSHAEAIINVLSKDVVDVMSIINKHFNDALRPLYDFDSDIKCEIKEVKQTKKPIREKDSKKIISEMMVAPNGLSIYNFKYNVAELSSNIGLIWDTDNTLCVKFMIRSPYDESMELYATRVISLAKCMGDKVEKSQFVSGWLPKENVLANIYRDFCKKMFKKETKQVLIGGSVEPAFILSNRQNMLGISIGPIMKNVHTFEEKLNIESTQMIYTLLSKFITSLKN